MTPIVPVQTERAASPSSTPNLSPTERHRLSEATRQFESMLLKRVLSSLERTSHLGSGSQAGASQYGSMVVEALADAIAQAGGLGLAKNLDGVVRSTPVAQAGNGNGSR